MQIEQLQLEEFRQYRRATIAIPQRGLAVHGANASGKSTMLEAISLLSTTKSPRTSTDREMIGWESGVEYGLSPYSRILGSVRTAEGQVDIEIGMAAEQTGVLTIRKHLKLNGRAVRAASIVGKLRSVLFTPEDVGLVTGPPSDRRRYLDLMICQIDPLYMRALSAYSRVLTQRNSLLKRFAREGVQANQPLVVGELRFWDDELVQAGAVILARRTEVIARLHQIAAEEYLRLDGGVLQVSFQPALGGEMAERLFSSPVLSREGAALALREQLELRRSDEVRRGVTLSGPHRDDFPIEIGGRSANAFASRGQQRLAVLALKLGEAALMTEVCGDAPVVMLDDILSELDERHRGLVLERALSLQCQMLITSTDRSLLELPIVRDLERRRVEHGELFADD